MRALRGGVLIAALMIVMTAGASAATPTVETWGYLPARDGTMLRYDLLRPAALAHQRLPVFVEVVGIAHPVSLDVRTAGIRGVRPPVVAFGKVVVRAAHAARRRVDPCVIFVKARITVNVTA